MVQGNDCKGAGIQDLGRVCVCGGGGVDTFKTSWTCTNIFNTLFSLKSVGIFEGKEEGLLISATRPPPPWIRRSSIDFQTNNSAAITGSVDK